MGKLKDQIPEGFFGLFTSVNRDIYLKYMFAVMDEISSDTGYAAKGLTKFDCRNIIASSAMLAAESEAVSETDEDIPSENDPHIFDNTYLNRLFKWGWLKLRYNETLDDYLVTIPEYSKIFVEAFRKLEAESVQSGIEMRAVYAYFGMYAQKHDREMLQAALESAKSLSIGISSSLDIKAKQIEELMKYDQGITMLQYFVACLESSELYDASTEQGRFYRYCEQTFYLLDREIAYVYGMLERADSEIYGSGTEDTKLLVRKNSLEEDIRTMAELKNEIVKSKELYEEINTRSADMATKAAAKLAFIYAKPAKENRNRLVQLISALAAEKKAGGTAYLDKVRKSLAFTISPKAFADANLYVSPERMKREDADFLAIGPDTGKVSVESSTRPKYTRREIKAFEKRFTENGRFAIGKDDICTDEDFDKLLYLSLHLMSEPGIQSTLKTCDEVRLPTGASFTSFSYDTEEKKDV